MWWRVILISAPTVSVSALGSLAQEGDSMAGAVVFKKCAVCHVVDAGKNKIGPSLPGLPGRKAGTTTSPMSSPI